MMRSYLSWIILGLVVMQACKTPKALSKRPTDATNSVLTTWSRLHTSTLPNQPWGGKGKLDIQSPKLNMQVNIQWHTISGQYLWLSVSKLGFETHRVMLRPDSVFIMDRLTRQYMHGDVNTWLAKQDFPFTYQDLDRLWYGLPLNHPLHDMRTEKSPQGWSVSGVDEHDIRYIYNLQEQALQSMQVSRDGYEMFMDQANFKVFNDLIQLPYHRKIKFRSDEDYAFDLNVLEVKADYPRDIIWRIPDGYEVLELP